ncbi:uncharacterized protein PITG_09738 [Phytophthora infestans T30-4]|uniref:Uncharacterized protein n=1 Tax=Phytophthora infestans (strain T30-4) TaxID=403677 RepID=D0NCP4_PHYIT|nr:uncharacterized protein PITG_09738 [Phytophthora infestans T30-4]EEY55758.1 hypothetical protein PITG_09738 [Phytophthora infestans T30-4]|eukprot:XP_002903334.1 hypothetical protein PITG_09738 [Phytophthora infestans T30-4]
MFVSDSKRTSADLGTPCGEELPSREPGLREVSGGDAFDDGGSVGPDGKRVIRSVGGVQALSDGFIDCCPSKMLADTVLRLGNAGPFRSDCPIVKGKSTRRETGELGCSSAGLKYSSPNFTESLQQLKN